MSVMLTLNIDSEWDISLSYDHENTIIAIVDKDGERAASIPLNDLELTLFIKQLGLIIDAKREECGEINNENSF